MPDEFDDAFRRLAAQKTLTTLASSQPAPDAAGKANAIARQTGLPPETADRNLTALEQQVRVAQARQLLDRYPALATWGSNPRNAAVGADDMDHLAKNAQQWEAVADAHDSIGPTAAPPPTLWNSVKGWGTAFVEAGRQIGSGIDKMEADYLPRLGLSRPGIPQLGNNAGALATRAYQQSVQRVDQTTPEFKSDFWRGLYGGVSSVVQMVPGIAASIATGNPTPALIAGGLQQGLPAYSKYRARGGTPNQALLGGALEGGIEVVTEKIPMGFLVNKLGSATGAKHFIAGYLGRELPTEIAATLGQNAVDTAIANPNKTWGQYLAEQPDAVVQTAIGTLVASSAFGGVHVLAQRHAEKAAQQEQAIGAADGVSQAMDAAAESKVRQRDPEAYRQFVALHTEGTPSEHMYFPAEKVAAYFQISAGLPV